jgi:hypothetical protein
MKSPLDPGSGFDHGKSIEGYVHPHASEDLLRPNGGNSSVTGGVPVIRTGVGSPEKACGGTFED